MNFFSPDLLLLSTQIAVLVTLASALALLIGWLLGARKPKAALRKSQSQEAALAASSSTVSQQEAQTALLAEELRRNLAAAESQCVTALEQRDEAERKAVQSANEVRDAQAQLAALKAELEAKNLIGSSGNDELRAQLAATEERCKAAAEQRDQAQRDVETRAAELAKVTSELAEIKGKLEQQEVATTSAQAQSEDLRQQLAQAEAKYQEAAQQAAAHATDLAAVTASLSDKESLASRSQEELAKARAEADELRSKLSQTESLYHTAQQQAEGHGAEAARITEELNAAKALVAENEALAVGAAEALRQQLAEAKAHHQEALSQATTHAAELVAVKAELADKDALSKGMGEALEKAQAEADELRAKLTQAETLYHDAQQQGAAHAAEIARINEELRAANELRQKLEEAERDCLAAMKEKAAADHQITSLSEELRKLNQESTAKLAEHQAATESAETLRHQLQSMQNSYAGIVTEIGLIKQQLHDSESKVAIREGQIEQLTKDKLESEMALKARIAELEGHAFKPAPAPVHKPSISLPKPPLPPVEVMAAPVDDSFASFPSAPEETGRRRLGASLFDDAAVTSFSPDVPSLDDVRATLVSLEQELQEKEQLVGVLTAEQAQRWDELEALRRAGPEAPQEALQAAEKEEQGASARLAETASDRDRCRRQVRALRRSLELADEHTGQSRLADDLTRIKGIKAGISQQLHAFGIFTYRQIVEWDEEDMAAFSELLAFKNRLHRDKWQDQARALQLAKYGK